MPEVNFLVKKGLTVPKGSAATPAVIFDASDPNTGIYSPGADQLALSTNGTGRLFVDADGRVLTGVGSTSNTCSAVFQGRSDGNLNAVLRLHPNTTAPTSAAGLGNITFGTPSSAFNGSASIVGLRDGGTWVNDTSMPGALTFNTTPDGSAAPQERLRIDSSGEVRIQSTVTTPETKYLRFYRLSTGNAYIGCSIGGSGSGQPTELLFGTNSAGVGPQERARIDSSGRLLVGTSTGTSTFFGVTPQLQLEGVNENGSSLSIFNNQNSNTGAYISIGKSRGSATGSSTIVNSGDTIGAIYWVGADGTDRNTPAAQISCQVDGTPGANDMPGRLVFSVTADGASSPTEAMRIKNSRIINIANTPTYADNAAAKAGGLVDGDVYRTATGALMIVYT